jgi:ParB family transcriptional regulator, chromosome partitioning protein
MMATDLEGDSQRAISAITIGNRHRRDLGDVSGLANSIAELGLLHPIVIRADGRLIAGERHENIN